MDGYSKWLAHTHTLCTHRYCYPVAMGTVAAEALPSFGIRCRWSKRHATVTHLQDDLAPVCCILLEQKWLCPFQHMIGLYLSADPCRQQGVRVREASAASRTRSKCPSAGAKAKMFSKSKIKTRRRMARERKEQGLLLLVLRHYITRQ